MKSWGRTAHTKDTKGAAYLNGIKMLLCISTVLYDYLFNLSTPCIFRGISRGKSNSVLKIQGSATRNAACTPAFSACESGYGNPPPSRRWMAAPGVCSQHLHKVDRFPCLKQGGRFYYPTSTSKPTAQFSPHVHTDTHRHA